MFHFLCQFIDSSKFFLETIKLFGMIVIMLHIPHECAEISNGKNNIQS